MEHPTAGAEPHKPVYVIYDTANPIDVAKITNNHEQADLAHADNHLLNKTNPVVAASLLYLTPELYIKMDDETWTDLAEGLDTLKHIHTVNLSGEPETPFFNSTPPDLPASMVELRMKRIAQFPAPVNMTAQRELTEILMAHAHNRPVNLELFTEASRRAPSWEQAVSGTWTRNLYRWWHVQELALLRLTEGNNVREQHGLPVPREDYLEEAQLRQSITEIEEMIEQQNKLSNTNVVAHDSQMETAMDVESDAHCTLSLR